MFKIIKVNPKMFGWGIVHKLVNSPPNQVKIKAFIIIKTINPKLVKPKVFIIILRGNRLLPDNKGLIIKELQLIVDQLTQVIKIGL